MKPPKFQLPSDQLCNVFQANHTLYLGTLQAASTLRLLKDHQIKTVISLGDTIPIKYDDNWGIIHYVYQVDERLSTQLKELLISTSVQIDQSLTQGNVLIHCSSSSMSTSSSVVIAFLMIFQSLNYEKAFYSVKKIKNSVNPNIMMKKLLLECQLNIQIKNSSLKLSSSFKNKLINNLQSQSLFHNRSITLNQQSVTSKKIQNIKPKHEMASESPPSSQQITKLINKENSEFKRTKTGPKQPTKVLYHSKTEKTSNDLEFSFCCQQESQLEIDNKGFESNITPFILNETVQLDLNDYVPTFNDPFQTLKVKEVIPIPKSIKNNSNTYQSTPQFRDNNKPSLKERKNLIAQKFQLQSKPYQLIEQPQQQFISHKKKMSFPTQSGQQSQENRKTKNLWRDPEFQLNKSSSMTNLSDNIAYRWRQNVLTQELPKTEDKISIDKVRVDRKLVHSEQKVKKHNASMLYKSSYNN